MSKKADAWRDYQEAAMVDMLLETLPKVCPFVRFSCCSETKNYFTDFSISRVLRSIVRKTLERKEIENMLYSKAIKLQIPFY